MQTDSEPEKIPMVSLEDVPFEDRAMLGIAASTEVSGSARVVYWWVLHVGLGKPIPFRGPALLAQMCGCSRSQCHRAIEQLVGAGFMVIGGDENRRTIQILAPKEVPQDIGIAWRTFVSKSVPERALSLHRAPGKKKEKAPPDPQNTGKTDPSKISKLRATPVTADDVAIICSSFENMERYLLHGRDKVLHPDQDFPPSSLNWRVCMKYKEPFSEEGMGAAEWDVSKLAGFFWFRVSYWRHQRGIPQGLPAFSRLCGDVKNLIKKIGGNWPMIQYINYLTFHFDLFCCMVGKPAENMLLDESALTHSLIQNAVKQYMAVGDAQRLSYEEQYAEKIVQRKQLYNRT